MGRSGFAAAERGDFDGLAGDHPVRSSSWRRRSNGSATIAGAASAIDWAKTLVSAVGAILIAALATGAFYGAMALDAPTTGVVLFFVVFLVGVIALAVVVNRRWPGAKAP